MKRMTDREFGEWLTAKIAWHYRAQVRITEVEWTNYIADVSTMDGHAAHFLTGERHLKIHLVMWPKQKPVKKLRRPSKKEIAAMMADNDDFYDYL